MLDVAALGARISAGWITASGALEALSGGPRADAAAGAVLLCAAAFAVGLAARLSGAVLAAAILATATLAAVPAPAAVLPAGTAAPWWIALAALCLLGAVLPGRLSADALLARRRRRRRHRMRGSASAGGERARTARRPEEAPPLPYPGVGAALKRPSRI
ncbi:histidine kinase [Streptomonospora sp. PA3]|uniref:histidine kinase n=1 Tax=Streptomonospora sp. PA3 TaxID=2607326 RepID=UPI0012DC27EF|nr:histidine kinase [Streptomonospora sp. PA3]MUL42992.1 histidine kinase [Streptomonospora sp. PA3]